jgi:IMP dehydrogenase
MLRPSYCFDDVLLRPRNSAIESRRDIDLSIDIGTKHRSLKLKTPLISSPMDTVTGSNMAISMALNGGLGIIHRYMPIHNQISEVLNVKRYINYIFLDPYKLDINTTYKGIINHINKTGVKTVCITSRVPPPFNKFIGIITNRDLQKLESLPLNVIIDKTLKELNDEYNIITSFNKMIYIAYEKETYKDMLKDKLGIKFEECMIKARKLMNDNSIEKIPIVLKTSKCKLEVKENINDDVMENANVNEILGMITRRSIEHYFNNRTRAALDSNGSLVVGAAIGIRDNYLENAKKLVVAGVDLLCIDVANGHNVYTINAVKKVRALFPDIIIMVGNVCTGAGFLKLANTDCDCIRVGIGNGSICSTRLETGNGYGQFSSINECYDIKNRHLLTTHIICDGGSLGKTGNKVKALASGAIAIIMGKTLACCEESPGSIIIRNGKRMKYYRGMASTMATISKDELLSNEINNEVYSGSNSDSDSNNKRKRQITTAEGVDGIVDLNGSVEDVINQINGGVRSGLSYQGCKTIKELHKLRKFYKLEWGIVSSIGMSETGIRVKTF